MVIFSGNPTSITLIRSYLGSCREVGKNVRSPEQQFFFFPIFAMVIQGLSQK